MSRRQSPEHARAVAHRLALLSAEIAAYRDEQPMRPASRSEPLAFVGPEELVESGEVVAASDPGPWTTWWPEDADPEQASGAAAAEEPDLFDAVGRSGLAGGMEADSDDGQWTLPMPGRHATGRAGRRAGLHGVARAGRGERDDSPDAAGSRAWWPELAQGRLRSRIAWAPVHLSLVSVLVACALLGTAWWLLQGRPEQDVTQISATQTPLLSGASASGSGPVASGGAAPSGAAETNTEVVVDVAGKVRHPGVRVLPAGSRVADAVRAAGGARKGVDLSSINLARLLVDGEQVLVGAPASAAGPAGAVTLPGAGSPAASSGALVNLNTADQSVLETLPGVGPVTASAILGYRAEHGGFRAVDELIDVDGIGEATLAKLAPLVTI